MVFITAILKSEAILIQKSGETACNRLPEKENIVNRKTTVAVIAGAAAAAAALLFCGIRCSIHIVNINGDPVKTSGLEDAGRLGDIYLEQYPEKTAVFHDADLEDRYISKSCTVRTSKTVFILSEITGYNLTADIKYESAGNGTVRDSLRQAAEDWNTEHAIVSENARISFDGDKRKYRISRDKTGKIADADLLIDLYDKGIRDIKTGQFIRDDKPAVTTADLKKTAAEANRVLSWHVRYSDGYTVRYPASCVAVSGSAVTIKNYDFHKELVKLDQRYNTAGQKHTARLHDGKKYSTSAGTWGYLTDSAEERRFLIKMFRQRKSVNDRKPVMKKRKPGLTIEVSIDRQHVWAYRGRKVIMESDCVTGRKGGHDTPKGIFYISQVSKDYDMKGDGYVSHCQRFMRITNTGIALHDAPWRSSFGGNIYQYNGSHGCINLPTAFALKLSEKVKAGNTMVIVH